jgi:hypothetical protein
LGRVRIFPAFLLMVVGIVVCRADLSEDLLAAVRKGDSARVKILLEQGADVNAKSPYGATGLFFAADRGNLEMIKILIDHGADVKVKDTFYGATALTWAAQKSHAGVVRLLLSKGAPGADEVLMTGISNGDAETVKAALEHKSEIKAELLSQALANAAKNNKSDLVDVLKSAGAQPAVKPNFQIEPETLKNYAGTYSGDGFDVKFAVVENRLSGGVIGQKPDVWDAVDKTTFQHPENTTLKIEFNVENGQVASVTIKRGDNKPTVLKKTGTQ